MPNILAGKEIIPEFIQHEALPVRIADAVWQLSSDPTRREVMISEMARVIERLGGKGAGQRAAEVVVRELESVAKHLSTSVMRRCTIEETMKIPKQKILRPFLEPEVKHNS